ncbi:Fyve, Rhogef And Ph Domain-Containing Protein 6 [Manis pentadactyla]|nr:Fyve, Rhogef And Ph Domain-Containing Protein 6 [Manis pentadactyla]
MTLVETRTPHKKHSVKFSDAWLPDSQGHSGLEWLCGRKSRITPGVPLEYTPPSHQVTPRRGKPGLWEKPSLSPRAHLGSAPLLKSMKGSQLTGWIQQPH